MTTAENAHRAQLGVRAIRHGDGDDNWRDDKQTALVDALANVMHAAGADDALDFDDALRTAQMHYGAEVNGE